MTEETQRIKIPAKELRGMSNSELEALLHNTQGEIAHLYNPQHFHGEITSKGFTNEGNRRRELKHNVARIKTEQHNREVS